MRFLRFVLLLFIIMEIGPPIANGASYNFLRSKKTTSFECPQIDDSNIVIFPSACNTADGSITGIKGSGGTGTFSFKWYDSGNTLLSTNADLLNVTAGTYTLELRDQSKCLAVTQKYTVGKRNPIIIDEGQLKITPADCNTKDGSVTGLNISNASQIQWSDAFYNVVGTNPDLKNVSNGYYTLLVTNADGCSTTKVYLVPGTTIFPQVTHIDTTALTCGNNSGGSITLTFNVKPTDPYYNYSVYYGSDSLVDAGVLLYNGLAAQATFPVQIANRPYTFILTDPKDCAGVIGQYSLSTKPFEIIEGPFFLVRNDACGRQTGGVFGLSVSGGTLPISYIRPVHQTWTWTDSLGNVLSQTPDLISVGKGTYTVTVRDVHGCRDTKTFTVLDSTAEAPPPGINGTTLCLPGTTTLSVINPNPAYKYRLYDSTQATLIGENNYGTFQQKVTKTTRFYATTVNGLCESGQTPVTVTVVAPGVIIPNTFTPNNDGINDYWDLPHIYDFPGAEISIYSRYGQQVYHSINYDHPFNGKYNGANLPTGAYYYVIDLKQPECFGKISGSLALIR